MYLYIYIHADISTHNRAKEGTGGESSTRWRTALVVAANMPGKELTAAATLTTHAYKYVRVLAGGATLA